MITILDRYLGGTVIRGALLALLVLASLSAFFTLLGELGDLHKDYDLAKASLYVLLTLPRRIYEMFPTAVLLGGLMSLGGLAANSELMVMRAAGVSVTRITLAVLQAGLILAVLAGVLGEVVAPPGEKYAQSMRSAAQTGYITLQSDNGFWARDGNNFVQIRRVLPGAQLQDITIYELDDALRLRSLIHARSASYIDGRWELEQVEQSRIDTAGVTTRALDSAGWRSLLKPDLLDVLSVKPEDLAASALSRYVGYLEENNLSSDRYRLAFWVKIVTPFSTLVMLLIAIPFVFGSLRSAHGGTRILVGVLLGMGFYLLNQALNHVGLVYGIPPILSALAPTLIFAAGGLYAISRIH